MTLHMITATGVKAVALHPMIWILAPDLFARTPAAVRAPVRKKKESHSTHDLRLPANKRSPGNVCVGGGGRGEKKRTTPTPAMIIEICYANDNFLCK